MEIKVFGWQHIAFLSVFVVAVVLSIILIKRYAKTDRAIKIILKCSALFHLATIIASRVSMYVWLDDTMALIPDSFCSLTSVLLPIGMLLFLKKDANYFHFVTYFAFVGGLVTLIYPDFIGQDTSFWFGPTITGLLHHAMMLYNTILLFVTHYFTPTLKKWNCLPLGGACVISYGVFLITAIGEADALHLESPLIDGTPLTWYFVALLTMVFAYGVMAIFDYFLIWKKKIKHK